MGSKCGCVQLPREVVPTTEINTVESRSRSRSRSTSHNRRFSIGESPLSVHRIFKYDSNQHSKPRYDMAQTMEHLVSGWLRDAMPSQSRTFTAELKDLCCRYASPCCSDAVGRNIDVLLGHWRRHMDMHIDLSLWSRFSLPIVHLEPLFHGDADSMGTGGFQALHEACDHKGSVLVVMRSTSNKQRFGAFTSCLGETRFDERAFLFNLTARKIFGIDKKAGDGCNVFACGKDSDVGLQFGSGPDLVVRKGGFSQNVNQCVPHSFEFSVDELNGTHDNGHFTLRDINVLRVHGI